jgi:hypothetical protein
MSFHSRRPAFVMICAPFGRASAVALSVWFAIREPQTFNRRVEQLAARRVHTPEVAGSSPASATIFDRTALAGGMRRSRRFRSSLLAPALCFSRCALALAGAFLLGCFDQVFELLPVAGALGGDVVGTDAVLHQGAYPILDVDHFFYLLCGAMLPGVGSAGLFSVFSSGMRGRRG